MRNFAEYDYHLYTEKCIVSEQGPPERKEPRSVAQDVWYLEIHFGKPVVARVRKCRLVVVKDRRARTEEEEDNEERQ